MRISARLVWQQIPNGTAMGKDGKAMDKDGKAMDKDGKAKYKGIVQTQSAKRFVERMKLQ